MIRTNNKALLYCLCATSLLLAAGCKKKEEAPVNTPVPAPVSADGSEIQQPVEENTVSSEPVDRSLAGLHAAAGIAVSESRFDDAVRYVLEARDTPEARQNFRAWRGMASDVSNQLFSMGASDPEARRAWEDLGRILKGR